MRVRGAQAQLSARANKLSKIANKTGARAHAYAHARASWPCLRTLSLLAHLARVRVKCSRAGAAHPATGKAPYINSYVLN